MLHPATPLPNLHTMSQLSLKKDLLPASILITVKQFTGLTQTLHYIFVLNDVYEKKTFAVYN